MSFFFLSFIFIFQDVSLAIAEKQESPNIEEKKIHLLSKEQTTLKSKPGKTPQQQQKEL